MFHVLFASFDRPTEAEAALEELRELEGPGLDLRVVTHVRPFGGSTEELPLFETRAAAAMMKGAIVGSVLGALGGALLAGPLGVAPGGLLATLAFTTATGALFGTFTGVIAGSTDFDPTLDAMMALGRDQTLLSIEAPTLTSEESARAVVLRHGGKLAQRRLLRARTSPVGR